MLKVTLQNHSSYAEEGQRNPIRWKTLFKQPDGSFIDQCGWVKCKDFFNDSVAYLKTGKAFNVYGYQNPLKTNDEGVYFLLKYIKDKKSFAANMEVINQRLMDDLGCVVTWEDYKDDELVILMPMELWENTYRMSLITMLIRLCNYGVTYKTWEDIWRTDSPVYTIEHSFTEDAKSNARKNGFTVPEKFSKYWFYAGEKHNSETIKPEKIDSVSYTIHNNGVSNWSLHMKMAG